MKCKINPKYKCKQVYKAGKGRWNYDATACGKCPIFRESHQLSLVQADPNRIFKCPKCHTQNVWYLHEMEVFRCKYCNHLFHENQAVTK